MFSFQQATQWALQEFGLGSDSRGEAWVTAIGILGIRIQTLVILNDATNRLLTSANEELARWKA